jgi:superfamily II DNA or RNA helicase
VQVASIQTLIGREVLPEASLVVIDEAHHFVAAEWGRVAQHYSTAKIVGVTATPERGDGTPLGDLFAELVPIVGVKELIDLGFLVPCDVVAPPKKTRCNSQTPLDAYLKHAAGRKAVVFAASVAEAYALAKEFTAAGHAAACVEGETPADDRDAILERFELGELQVVTNVYCLTEGWDCPSVEVCIVARGCSATGTWLQMIGRVLRPSPGKSTAIVIDLRGAVHEHGLPDDDRVFSLDGRAISVGEAPVKTCPECEHVIPLSARVCPNCGNESAGSDREDDGERHDLIKISKKDRERGYFLEQLDLAHRRGYRPGWAAHRFQEKFKRFPAALWRELVGRGAAA